jgi:hypothetical protein
MIQLYYPSELSCKQDLEIFEAVSKILSRSLEDNSPLCILIASDTSVPKIFVRSVQRFLDLKIIEKILVLIIFSQDLE